MGKSTLSESAELMSWQVRYPFSLATSIIPCSRGLQVSSTLFLTNQALLERDHNIYLTYNPLAECQNYRPVGKSHVENLTRITKTNLRLWACSQPEKSVRIPEVYIHSNLLNITYTAIVLQMIDGISIPYGLYYYAHIIS